MSDPCADTISNADIGYDAVKISVITAVYNSANTLADAIASIASQSHDDIEHLIVDGASTDTSLDVIKANAHARMTAFSEPDDGIYDAINKGIRRATGDIVGLVHSDDFLAGPDTLAEIAHVFQNPNVEAFYSDLDYVSKDDTGKVIRHWKSGLFHPQKLRRGWMPPHPTLYLRRDVFERYGLYDTRFRISADYDFILRYFTKTRATPVYLPKVMYKMRVGGVSNSNLNKIVLKSREDYDALSRNNVGGLSSLVFKNVSKVGQFLRKSPQD